MKWTLDHSRLPVFIRVDVEGKATIEGALALWDELISSDHWQPGMSVLVDSTDLSPLGVEATRMIQALVRFFIDRKGEIGKSCIATIRQNAEAYLYVRQFEYGIRLRGSAVVVRNFVNAGHALDWLTNHAGTRGAFAEA